MGSSQLKHEKKRASGVGEEKKHAEGEQSRKTLHDRSKKDKRRDDAGELGAEQPVRSHAEGLRWGSKKAQNRCDSARVSIDRRCWCVNQKSLRLNNMEISYAVFERNYE